MNPYAMARRMPAWLLSEWEAYYALEPFGEERADIRSAHIVQMLYNINRDSKKEPKGRPLTDFLFEFDKEELTAEQRAKNIEDKMRVMELIARAQAEANAEMAAKVPRVIEFHYPGSDVVLQAAVEPTPAPVVDEDAVQAALEKARAAWKQVS